MQIARPERHWFRRGEGGGRGPFRGTGVWLWLLLVLVGGFALGFAGVALLFFPGAGRPAIVTVPDVRGIPVEEAEREVGRAGLTLVRGERLPNPRVAAGAVLVQSPLAGQEVTRGAEVRVVVSGGPERRAVPAVAGLSVRDAQALLTRHGFAVQLRSVQNDAAEGAVLGVHPAAGEEAVVPSQVTLFVSSGPPKVLVPDVVSLPVPEAQTRLQATGLRLGGVAYDSLSGGVLGGIIRQRPAAGDSLARGRAVSVTVAGRDPTPPPPDPSPPAEAQPAPQGERP